MRAPQALLALVCSLPTFAQATEKSFATDTGTVILHFFTTGQPSTKAWMDAANRWGHSWAYNKQGQVIFERQTRHFAGHASVVFRYHPNGGISRAEVDDAPDGGIQWFRSTTTFDTAGVQTGYSEQGWDNEGPIGPQVTTKQYKQQEVREPHLFNNEYFVVARKNCRVQLRPKCPGPAAKDLDATLLKGDTLRGGMYSLGERFGPPLVQVAVTATNRRGKPKYEVQRTDSVQMGPEHRRWYLIIGR